MSLVVTEEFLEQVERLEMLIENNVAGRFGGNHKSKTFGSSCEFADFRDYIPGDDIQKIDWNAFARFKKLYLRLYLDERQVHTKIYIDVSKSMSFGRGKKDEQAIKLAAAFAYLSVSQMDRVSIYLIRGGQVETLIENMLGKESYLNYIGALNDVVFDGDDARISEAILPTSVGYGDGLSIIISDFLTDSDFFAALDHLASKKRDILCIQVLSKEELDPRVRGKMHFFDSEDSGKVYRKNINKEIIRAYMRALEFVTNRIDGYAHAVGGEYALVSAQEPLGDIFFDKLISKGVFK